MFSGLRSSAARAWNSRKVSYGVFAAVLSMGSVIISAAQTMPGQPSPGVSEGRNANYRIGVGDVLKVLVFKQDILTQDGLRVANDGTIRMPMINEPIGANCMTEAELSADLTERYRKFILNPQIYVTVKEYNAYPVAIVGAVNSPGRFQLQRPMRVLELLTFVNGPALNAGPNLQIIRNLAVKPCETTGEPVHTGAGTASDDQVIISLPLAAVMKGNDNSNPYVQAGDIIRVSEAELKQAFIIGSVKSALAINLKEPVTLSRAIAMAGGVAGGGNIEKIKISRQSAGSLEKTELIANLKDPKGGDMLLQPNDVIDVPGPSGTKKLFRDIIRSVIPAVTRVPMVIP
jgi:polysaccharide export outer membrane protein